jgi:hypothetical protein
MNNVKRCWREYNKSLVQRGSITLWIDEDFLKNDQVFESLREDLSLRKPSCKQDGFLKLSIG